MRTNQSRTVGRTIAIRCPSAGSLMRAGDGALAWVKGATVPRCTRHAVPTSHQTSPTPWRYRFGNRC